MNDPINYENMPAGEPMESKLALARGTICSNCHNADDFATRKTDEVHSKVCGY